MSVETGQPRSFDCKTHEDSGQMEVTRDNNDTVRKAVFADTS